MPSLRFDLWPTRAFAALALKNMFLSPVSLLVYVLALAPFWLRSTATGDYIVVAFITALLFFGLYVVNLFIRRKLEHDEEPVISKNNLGCYITFAVVRRLRNRGNVTLPKLLLAASGTKRGLFILRQLGKEQKEFLQRCMEGVSKRDDVLLFIGEAVECAKELGEKRVDSNAILFAFFKRGGVFKEFLNECDVSLDDVRTILKWEGFHEKISQREWLFHPHRLVRSLGTIGRSWVQGYTNDLDMILDIPVQLTVELGRTKMPIKNLLQLAQGSVVELSGMAGEPLDVMINGFLIAQGEVVVVNDKLGIRLTDITTPSERLRRINR